MKDTKGMKNFRSSTLTVGKDEGCSRGDLGRAIFFRFEQREDLSRVAFCLCHSFRWYMFVVCRMSLLFVVPCGGVGGTCRDRTNGDNGFPTHPLPRKISDQGNPEMGK